MRTCSDGGGRGRLRGWRRRVACVLALVALAVPSEAAWHRVDSPNFVVVGDASPRELRDIAVKFEAFRESLARLRGREAAPAPVPTVVIAFRSDKAFTPFKPRYKGRATDVAGLFVGERDANQIALLSHLPSAAERGDQFRARLIYHEYAHLVISDEWKNVPAWLNEGLAEFYSTFEVGRDGREIVIGRPIREHVALLNDETLLKLTDLLQVDQASPLYNEGERRSLFYAQSWALVHMIRFQPERTKQLAAYLQRLSQGTPSLAAWKDAFGDAAIEAELQRYIRRDSFTFMKLESPEQLTRFEVATTPLKPAEIQGFLAQFLLAQGRYDEAATQAAGTADQRDGMATVIAAQLANARRDYAATIETLVGLPAPTDWLTAYYAGVTLSEAVEHTEDKRPDVVAAAVRFFDKARREREYPNAVIRRAALQLAAEQTPADATILAVHGARTAAPGREDFAYVHAHLLARKSEFAAARSIAGPLLASTDARVRESGRSLMKWIVQLEKHHASRAAAESQQSAPPPASADTPRREPVSRLEPVFRKMEANEQRVDGLLQHIECSRRGAVTFVLQSGENSLRLPAPRLQDVEFITYRADLAGNVSCGPLKEPMRVYVTSRAATAPNGSPVVVAIEFLPKDMQ